MHAFTQVAFDLNRSTAVERISWFSLWRFSLSIIYINIRKIAFRSYCCRRIPAAVDPLRVTLFYNCLSGAPRYTHRSNDSYYCFFFTTIDSNVIGNRKTKRLASLRTSCGFASSPTRTKVLELCYVDHRIRKTNDAITNVLITFRALKKHKHRPCPKRIVYFAIFVLLFFVTIEKID